MLCYLFIISLHLYGPRTSDLGLTFSCWQTSCHTLVLQTNLSFCSSFAQNFNWCFILAIGYAIWRKNFKLHWSEVLGMSSEGTTSNYIGYKSIITIIGIHYWLIFLMWMCLLLIDDQQERNMFNSFLKKNKIGHVSTYQISIKFALSFIRSDLCYEQKTIF